MKLSIITINLNNASGLQKTIESVNAQSCNEFEYIIIDGGSSDCSLDVLSKFSDKLTYLISEPDKGIYNAMNKGILNATGEYCLFLNSGDCLISNSILKEVLVLFSGEDIIYGNGILSYKDGKSQTVNPPEALTLDFFCFNSLFHQSAFIKRELFDRFGLYNESNKIVSDWEWFLKTIMINNVSTRHIPVVISITEDGGISRNPENMHVIEKECDTVLKKYFPLSVVLLLAEHKKIKADLNWIKSKPGISAIFRIRTIKHRMAGRKLEKIFTNVYRNNYWGGKESSSGPGSDEDQTSKIQKQISALINERKIKTIIDAPCGDFLWMKNVIASVYENIDSFTGFDIVDELVGTNNTNYSDSKISFKVLDLTVSDIPACDLIICRDCFIHLSFKNIYRILKRFKNSGSGYLLLSTYTDSGRKNLDINDFRIDFRALNMQKFPFSFPKPEQIINEGCQEFEGIYSDKSLALYKIQKIDVFRMFFFMKLWNIRFLFQRIKLIRRKSIYYLKN
jgi:glycosyltransferase involved in cell wall biosynthesis